jgi:hypothetical protein
MDTKAIFFITISILLTLETEVEAQNRALVLVIFLQAAFLLLGFLVALATGSRDAQASGFYDSEVPFQQGTRNGDTEQSGAIL